MIHYSKAFGFWAFGLCSCSWHFAFCACLTTPIHHHLTADSYSLSVSGSFSVPSRFGHLPGKTIDWTHGRSDFSYSSIQRIRTTTRQGRDQNLSDGRSPTRSSARLPIVLASIFKTVGESDTALQFLQITVDSGAVVVLFLISLELFSLSVSLVAGFLAALSPQFAYFSVLLLPDSLIVFPILLAIYLVVTSRRRLSWSRLVVAGILIGMSCWLRANALLLPLFVGAATALITPKDKRLSAAAAVIIGAILAIAPITIKNAIVFHRFIPLSLGSGQTLLEGLADYDPKGTLNIPNTDLGLSLQEAQWYGRPDYGGQLFGADGIERDRMRVARGVAVIRSHPIWFAGVMGRRALASTRLDPVSVLQPVTPVTHRWDDGASKIAWENYAGELPNVGSHSISNK